MKYREMSYYGFSLRTALMNLWRNGFKSGAHNTVSFILQPITSYTRFPEYFLMEEWIRGLQAGPDQPLPDILDIGSPKPFGLYMAFHYRVRVWMTDISPLNIDPYISAWDAIKSRARGEARFQLQDVRGLTYTDAKFHAAYSMSVLEHVEGNTADTAGITEMMRVVKPRGLLIISVPFGPKYLEQTIRGIANSVKRTGDKNQYFFQRVYDRNRLMRNLIDPLETTGKVEKMVTVYRHRRTIMRWVHWMRANLPTSVVGSMGFVNPFLSPIFNVHTQGFADGFYCSYGDSHSFKDIYGDLALAVKKRGDGLG
jgi:SAM-dependent methyltransferase